MLKLTKSREKRLSNIYYNKKGGAGAFSGSPIILKNIYNETYPQDKINTKLATVFLQNQYVYQRHRNRRKIFPRNMVYSPAPGVWFGIDLADFGAFSDHNDGFRYILIGCDIFSKMVYGEALKNKDKTSVLDAFKKMLPKIKHRPLIVCSDLGSEFLAKVFQNYLKKEKIHFVSLQGQYHNSVTERHIRTIKDKFGRLWTNLGEPVWVEHLQEVITSYNNTKHSRLKIAPIEVEEFNSDIIHRRLYPKKIDKVPGKFKIGDLVRISLILDKFAKAYEGVFSKQTFLITHGPFYPQKGKYPLYKIGESFSKEPIPGSWYEYELQKINKNKFGHAKNREYDIKVLESSGNKSKIHYVGWSKKYDHWVPTKSIINRKIK